MIVDIKEPKFEYDFPKPYIRDQTWFPLRQPFNIYLDKYRDPKEVGYINRDIIILRLLITRVLANN